MFPANWLSVGTHIPFDPNFTPDYNVLSGSFPHEPISTPTVDHAGVTNSPSNPDMMPDALITLNDLQDAKPDKDPGYSVHKLIQYAIQGSPTGKLLLSDICKAIEARFPSWYGDPKRKKALYCSVRHHLTWYPKFVTAGKPTGMRGKSRWWTIETSKLYESPKTKAKAPRNPKHLSSGSHTEPTEGQEGNSTVEIQHLTPSAHRTDPSHSMSHFHNDFWDEHLTYHQSRSLPVTPSIPTAYSSPAQSQSSYNSFNASPMLYGSELSFLPHPPPLQQDIGSFGTAPVFRSRDAHLSQSMNAQQLSTGDHTPNVINLPPFYANGNTPWNLNPTVPPHPYPHSSVYQAIGIPHTDLGPTPNSEFTYYRFP